MAYQISLENFEGPFDLLLFLIQKNQVDIYDIPIAEITGQYLQTIRDWQELDLDIASEFITMAARLMEIKSRTLLPVRQDDDDAAVDPKEALAAQLMTYQVFKRISGFFREREKAMLGLCCKEPEFLPELEIQQEIDIDGKALSRVMQKMLDLYRDDHAYKPFAGKIRKDLYRVEDKIARIEAMLQSGRREPFAFSQLITAGEQQEVIVAFQAVLECYKSGRIQIRQAGIFDEIAIYPAEMWKVAQQ